jgi:hypothetical protein
MEIAPSAEQARSWVEKYQAGLNAAFQLYLQTGEWPVITDLQRHFDRNGVNVDAQEMADSKPTVEGQRWVARADFLSLQIRHLMWLDEAQQLVRICMNATEIAVEAYMSDMEPPQVTSDHPISPFPFQDSPTKLRAYNVMLMDSPSPFSGGGMSETSWNMLVDTRFARNFKGVTSAAEFCAVQDGIRATEMRRSFQGTIGQTEQPPTEQDAGSDQPKLFLSWGKPTSKQIAHTLRDLLQPRLPDVDIFFSPESIDPGEDPNRALFDEGLLKCDALVVVLTEESAKSLYVTWETASAWAMKKLVIPIFVDVAPGDVPGPLAGRVQGVFLRDAADLHRGFVALAKELGVPDIEQLTDAEHQALCARADESANKPN